MSLYLEEIEWAAFIQKPHMRQYELQPLHSFRNLPFWRVHPQGLSEYVKFARDYYHDIAYERDWTGFELALGELLNNVYDHADSPIGAYTFSQYQKESGVIRVAVGDLGIGLANKVNHYLSSEGRILSSSQAVEWAVAHGNSTRSTPRNRGYGLDNVTSFARNGNGRVTCYISGQK